MKAEIIAVGTELLLGQIANTNGQYLSTRLAGQGIHVYKHTVVGDNMTRIRQAVREAAGNNDIVLLTGGLGPTEDDVTRNAVAAEYGLNLTYDEESLQKLARFFEERGRPLTEANKRQALCIEGSHVFQNHAGLACGMAFNHQGTLFLLLPGPPHEMKEMFTKEVSPYVSGMDEEHAFLQSRTLRFFGIGESDLEARVHDLIVQQTNPTIAPLAGQDEVTLRLTVRETEASRAMERLDQVESKVLERVREFFYGYDDDTLFSRVLHACAEKKWTLATAESLTGGLLGSLLTEIPGASTVYNGGAVTYSTRAKVEVLGVSEKTISQTGAVSEATAKEMAEGIKLAYAAEVGISLTGVAGPDDQEGHRPGTLFIGIAFPEVTHVYKRQLRGDRFSIRNRAAKEACACLLKEEKKGD